MNLSNKKYVLININKFRRLKKDKLKSNNSLNQRNKDYPYEKKTHRYKINYYVGKDFEDKYKDKEDSLEMRKVENEIENKYLTYLKIECQERTQLREEIKYKMIYYGKGTYYYSLLNRELQKIDLSVCDKLKKHINKINANEDDDEEDDFNTDDD